MVKKTAENLNRKIILIILWIGALLVNVKGIFSDFGPDQTYAMSTSYRHLMGDRMFQEMWEPHQTSGFLSDFGMWLYRLFVPSYEGVALFLQFYGVVLFGIVTFILYRVLRKYISREITHLICIFFFAYRPKLMVYPEFSNLHILFCVLLFLCLSEYIGNEEKVMYLVGAAFCTCLLILAYPSCLIHFGGGTACLIFFTRKKWKNVAIFSGICFAAGAVYVGYFIGRIGAVDFLRNLRSIFSSDVSHTAKIFSPVVFFRGTVYGIAWLAAAALVSYLYHRFRHGDYLAAFMVLICVSDVLLLLFAKADWTTPFFILNGAAMLLGLGGNKYLEREERRMWVISIVLSLCSALAVFLLTNQELLSLFAYMAPGAMISFVPIGKMLERKGRLPWALILFCLFVVMHRGITIYGYINVDGDYLITDVRGMVRVGPTRGIVTSREECAQAKYGIEDWKRMTSPGMSVLMVEETWYDSVVYFYNDNAVAAYSTIDTPVYDESLDVYWRRYPEKRPEAIAVKKYGGREDRPYEGWFARYLEEEYETTPWSEGTYWIFYYRKKDLEGEGSSW